MDMRESQIQGRVPRTQIADLVAVFTTTKLLGVLKFMFAQEMDFELC